jgi:multiple sugar transport system substrate-binding protein/sn-glycerol 3-phosphate transport system substrate-binding protein
MNKKLTDLFPILFAVALFLTLSLSLEDGGVQAAPRPPASAPAATPATFSTWLPLTLSPKWAYHGEQIPFWHPYYRQKGDIMEKMVGEFDTSNLWEVAVDAQFQGGYSSIYQKMLKGIPTGEMPGLVVAYQNQAATYQTLDALVDIDAYVQDPEWGLSQHELDDYFPAILQADVNEQFGGMRLGFPTGRSVEVMYYNLDWLKELGYDGPPTTWEQFREMACKAVQQPFSDGPAGETPIGYEFNVDASRFASMVFSRGGDLINADMSAYTLNTSQSRDAMIFMWQLYQDSCASLVSEPYGDQSDFVIGKALFTTGSSSGLPYYKSGVNGAAGFQWSVAALPHTTTDPVVDIYGASVSIPKTTPEEQLGAWLFLKWFTQPEQQAAWARTTNYFPVRRSAANALQDYFAANPAYAKAFNLLPYGKSEPPVACYDAVRMKISAAYVAILNGADIPTTLAQLEREANEALTNCQP